MVFLRRYLQLFLVSLLLEVSWVLSGSHVLKFCSNAYKEEVVSLINNKLI